MSIKALEREFSSLLSLHSSHLSYWQGVEPSLTKAARAATNHRQQEELFATLAVEHLAISAAFPGLREELVYKLSTVARQHRAGLEEQVQVLTHQLEAVMELADKVRCRCRF